MSDFDINNNALIRRENMNERERFNCRKSKFYSIQQIEGNYEGKAKIRYNTPEKEALVEPENESQVRSI